MHVRHRGRPAALAAILAAAFAATAVTGVGAAPQRQAMEASAPSPAALASLRGGLLRSVSADRAAAGLRALREDRVLDAVAQERAMRLAAASEFSHAAAGPPILVDVQSTGLSPYGAGEALGWSTAPGTAAALDAIRRMWLASPGHRAILLTRGDNYIGVGVATRGGTTFATIVVADTRDRTAPVVRVGKPGLDGTTVTFSWVATDPLLQTHAAGLRSVAVEVRTDAGPWRTVRTAAGASSIELCDRVPGHAYSVRVRARDGSGNLSAWTAPRTIVVP